MNEFLVGAGVFLVALASVYFYRKLVFKKDFIFGIDINKKDRRKIPESAGIALLVPLWVGIIYMSLTRAGAVNYVAWGALMSTFSVIGLMDDTRQKFMTKPMPWVVRALPVAFASLLFAANFTLDVLWVVPISLFIAGVASFQNTFAGLNGWEIGSGFIISCFVAYLLYPGYLFMPAVILCVSILALLLFNKYPAKVFPGDSGTLLIGAGIAGLMVLRGVLFETIVVALFFVPHIADILLKAITNPKDMSQSKGRPYDILEDGRLSLPKERKFTYDFGKLILKIFGPLKEWQIVAIIWACVIVNCSVVLALFWTF